MPTKLIYISKETIADTKEMIEDAIESRAKMFGVEPALIRAIIKAESNGYIFAYRIDYNVLKGQKWYAKTLNTQEKKQKKYWASYGLMQVLYGNAKHNGYEGRAEGLMNVATNISHGCLVIKSYMRSYSDIKDIIAAYNGGYWVVKKRRKENAKKYFNQKYVDKVYKYYKKFGGTA